MLAILQIKMEWTKDSRTLTASRQRQEYYKPVMIENDVSLSGNGIFLKKCNYLQQNGSVLYDVEASEKLDRQLYEENIGVAFTGRKEHEQKMALYRNTRIRREKGAFYSPDKIDIPCVKIIEKSGGIYRVKWFDDGRGMPKRRGGNEDLYVKGEKLTGCPNTLNETAFVLGEGESGVLRYNFRLLSYDEQWYECYYVYIVNTKELLHDVFVREYTYEYSQLADLF
ncbi:MAG: hypothetical protein K2I10_11245 [Lachnospiraceae bacterium]|nr:hypothetical protein [Lachnospiraceae bacterium]